MDNSLRLAHRTGINFLLARYRAGEVDDVRLGLASKLGREDAQAITGQAEIDWGNETVRTNLLEQIGGLYGDNWRRFFVLFGCDVADAEGVTAQAEEYVKACGDWVKDPIEERRQAVYTAWRLALLSTLSPLLLSSSLSLSSLLSSPPFPKSQDGQPIGSKETDLKRKEQRFWHSTCLVNCLSLGNDTKG